MKLHLPKGLRTALLALFSAAGLTLSPADAVTSTGYTIITFGDLEQSWANYQLDVNEVQSATGTLGTTGVAYTMSSSFAVLRSHSNVVVVPDTWNAEALASMNKDMGTSLTTAQLGTAKIIASGGRDSENTLMLNSSAATGESSFAVGAAITIYVGVSGTNGSPANAYNVSGLKDVQISYAAAEGSGFTSTVTYTPSSATTKTLSIVKIEGTVEDASDVHFWASAVNNNKVGMVFVAYQAQAPAGNEYVWTGAASGTWDTTTVNWTKDSTADHFESGADVTATFNTGVDRTALTVAEDITAKTVAVNGDYSFTLSGSNTLATAGLSVAEDKTLTVEGTGSLVVDEITGNGKVVVGSGAVFSLNTQQDSTISLPEQVSITGTYEVTGPTGGNGAVASLADFTGDLRLKSGRIDLQGSALNAATKLMVGSGDNWVVVGSGTVDIANELEYEGDGTLCTNSGTTGNVSGAVTGGTGTVKKEGAGKAVLTGKVTLSNLDVRAGRIEILGSAGDKDTIAGLTSSAGTTTVLANTNATAGTADRCMKGSLVLQGGATLTLASNDSLSWSNTNTVTIEKDAVLDMNTHRWTISTSNSLVLAGGTVTGVGDEHGALDFHQDGATVNTTEDSVVDATVRLRNANQTTNFFVAEGKELTVSGLVKANGGLNKTGAGTLVLSHGNNSFTGPLTVTAGTLQVAAAGALGAGTSAVANSGVVDFCAEGEMTVTRAIGGTGSLLQSGSGTTILSTANTHSGGTTVSAGKLQVGNAGALGTGGVTLAGGELNIAAATSLGSQKVTQTGGSISVAESGSLTLGEAELNAAIAAKGAVSFTGQVTLADSMEENTVAASLINEQGQADEHDGFRNGGSSYVELVTLDGGTATAVTGTTFIYKNTTYAATALQVEGTSGRVITKASTGTDWTAFLITTDFHQLSAIAAKAAAGEATLAKVEISGGALTVDSTALATAGSIEATGGSVTLQSAVGTINVGDTAGLTISGTATATAVNVKGDATIAGAFHSGTFGVDADKTATVTGAADLGTLQVQGTLALTGAATAVGGTVQGLALNGGSLTTTADLYLTDATGTGSLSLDGTLTLDGSASLGNVTVGSLVLGDTASLTLTGSLTSSSITLDVVSRESVYLTAGSLGAATTDFVVDTDMVVGLGLQAGETVALAKVAGTYGKKLTVNGGSAVFIEGAELQYIISQKAGEIILTAASAKDEYVWANPSGNWSDESNWQGHKEPGAENWVQLKDIDAEITLDVEAEADRMTVYEGVNDVINGDNTLSINNALEIYEGAQLTVGDGNGSTFVSAETGQVDGTLVVEDGSVAAFRELNASGSGAILVEQGGNVVANRLLGGKDAVIGGTVDIISDGTVYSGHYDNATVDVGVNGSATLGAAGGLTVAGSGNVTLKYDQPASVDSIQADGMTLTLNGSGADNSGKTLAVEGPSSLRNGKIVTGLSAVETAETIDSGAAPQLVSVGGGVQRRTIAAGLDLSGTTVVINQTETGVEQMTVHNGGKAKGLVLATLGNEGTNAAVSLNGNLFTKYYKNARLVNGAILVDMNDTFFQGIICPVSGNSRCGAAMLDDAFAQRNPQLGAPDGDLAKVMDALENGTLHGPAAETVAAAMAGASAAAMGAALGYDVDRQLRTIRNRTTGMGLEECVRHEGLPYFNAWVNAEGDYNKLGNDGTLAGYKMSSWGATLGVSVNFTGRLTAGLAVTAMRGSFTASSAEQAKGDLDRIYASAFARYAHRAWSHVFVATLGTADTSLDRTVDYGTDSYTVKGDSHGSAFGLMYETSYTKALDEDGATCLQPLFNISYRHSSLGGFNETGSDAALSMGNVDMDTVSFGLGARLQSVVGTSVYNRSSLFEGRALLRLDAGDRSASAKVNFAGVAGGHRMKSAEVGAFGLELGAGLTLPVSEDAGSIFADVALELRDSYTNVNGTVGYRFSF